MSHEPFQPARPTAEQVQALRPALLQWCAFRRRQSELEPHCASLASSLQGTSAFFSSCGARLAERLVERMAGAAALAEAIRASGTPTGDPALAQWLAWASAVAEAGLPSRFLHWPTLLGELSQRGNLLATANVSHSLADAAQAGAPRMLIAPLEALRAHDTQWCQGYPLPPAAGRSPRAADYLLSQDVQERFDGWQPQLAVSQATFAQRLRDQVALPPQQRAALAQLAAVARELHTAAQWVRQGWPVERPWLKWSAATAIAMLRALPSTLWTAPDEAQAAISLYEQMEQAADIARPAPEANISNEESPPQGSDTVAGLRELAVQLHQAAEPEARQFAERLDHAAGDEACANAQEGARRRLNCLAHIDDLWLRPGKRPDWLSDARQRLRESIAADGVYQLIDTGLLGRHPDECAELIEITGFAKKTKVAGGRIAEVRQPGYTSCPAGGARQVLRRAKVLLAP